MIDLHEWADSFSQQHASLAILAFLALMLLGSPRVPTGIVGSTGLILFSVGCIAGLDPASIGPRAFALRSVGILLTFFALIWFFLIRRWWLRWSAKWKAAHQVAWFFGLERRKWKDPNDRRKE